MRRCNQEHCVLFPAVIIIRRRSKPEPNPAPTPYTSVHFALFCYIWRKRRRESERSCVRAPWSKFRLSWWIAREAGGERESVYRNHQTIDQMLFFPSIDTMAERAALRTPEWAEGCFVFSPLLWGAAHSLAK